MTLSDVAGLQADEQREIDFVDVDADGHAKVIDFGIARPVSE